jgi:hypothetical protein
MKAKEMTHLIEYYFYNGDDTCIELISNGKDKQVIEHAQIELNAARNIYNKAVVQKYNKENVLNPWSDLKVLE